MAVCCSDLPASFITPTTSTVDFSATFSNLGRKTVNQKQAYTRRLADILILSYIFIRLFHFVGKGQQLINPGIRRLSPSWIADDLDFNDDVEY